jgi:hypothetical protein
LPPSAPVADIDGPRGRFLEVMLIRTHAEYAVGRPGFRFGSEVDFSAFLPTSALGQKRPTNEWGS